MDFEDGRVVETKALIDSGAGGLFIDKDFIKKLRAPLTKPIPVINVNGTSNKNGIITQFARKD